MKHIRNDDQLLSHFELSQTIEFCPDVFLKKSQREIYCTVHNALLKSDFNNALIKQFICRLNCLFPKGMNEELILTPFL